MERNRDVFALVASIVLFMISACANRGSGPQGGERDETPPLYLRSSPRLNQTEFKKNRMIIEFDEYILLDGQSEKVIVSPPQVQMPTIRTSGKRVLIELKDTMKDSTTYVIDFADAIKDNNEGNILSNFVLAFSTGKSVDTMEISGRIFHARDLEPEKYMLIGVHRSMEDSSFTNQPFERVTRCNEFGYFTLKNLSPGKYRLFGLREVDNNFQFNNPTEDYAFSDSLVLTTVSERTVIDTIRIAGTKQDTVVKRNKPDYFPKDLFLMSFNEGFKNLYLDKSERKQANKLSLFFTAPMDSMPEVRLLNHDLPQWATIERSATNDSIHYWIKDSTIYKLDSLILEAKYLKHDTSMKLQPIVDTLIFSYEKPIVKEEKSKSKRKKREAEKPQTIFLGIKTNTSGSFFIESPFQIISDEPLVPFNHKEIIHLFSKQDTLWESLNYKYRVDTLNPKLMYVEANWKFGGEYKIEIDSAALLSYSGLHNNKLEAIFKVSTEDTYSNLFFNIEGVVDSAFVELLKEDDKAVRIQPVIKGQAEFFYLTPGKYGARMVIDRNGNGVWDAGKFAEKRQPEKVIYYPQMVELRANSDYEQSWNINATPLLHQKPKELIKNKPKEEVSEDENKPKNRNERLPQGVRQF